MKPLFLIPARGGSKGIPGKNIKELAGKPLIFYTIEAVRSIASDQDICVSTDSIEIKSVVESTGLKVPFLRPEHLATDQASGFDVIVHALEYYKSVGKEYEYVVVLQPTSPLRKREHIKEAISLIDNEQDMVVSVKETKANPYFNLFEENNEGYLKQSKEANFTRRQDCPKVYEYNGAIYVIKVDALQKRGSLRFDRIIKYVMKDVYSVDIDDELDWLSAESILTLKDKFDY